MATLNLTREETAKLEYGRNLATWPVMNHYFPEYSPHEECYTIPEEEYQDIEDNVEAAINNNDEVWGINENNETYTVVIYTNRKPKGTRPPF